MQPVKSTKRDPAPSRTAYRIHRLWLTPFFRGMLKIGLPLASVFLVAGWYFSDATNRREVTDTVAEIRAGIEQRPEFMVRIMAIDGATDEIDEDIREITPIVFPISSFDLDLPELQDRIEELDAVARVDLQVRTGGILQVTIQERIPAIVWRAGFGLELLDENGHRVAAIDARTARSDLPLIVGDGAQYEVEEALQLLKAADPVAPRIRGLVRVGERRWDLVLDRDQRIMLPEKNPIFALQQVMALHSAQDLMARDILIVDMRNKNRPTLRVTPNAVEETRRIKVLRPGEARND